MNRRTLLTLAAASMLPTLACADGFVAYTPGLIEEELAAGKTVFVDYSATWCTTCARQERVIDTLRGQNPDYDAAMTFIKVDWDTYGTDAVTTSRAIPRRSTLIVLRGENELGRIVAGTSESQIKELMNLGL